MPFIEKDFPIESIDEIAWGESNARKPIYHIHKWFARRVGSTFRALILSTFLDENPMKYYYQQIKLKIDNNRSPIILDPFMGGGTTIVEGHRLGCKMIGVDINPLAWFITKMELLPLNSHKIKNEFSRIKGEIKDKITVFYKTKCKEGHSAEIMYTFWIKRIECENCHKSIALHKSFVIAKPKQDWVYFCPGCGNLFLAKGGVNRIKCPACEINFNPSHGYAESKTYSCPHCSFNGDILNSVQQKKTYPELHMYGIELYCSLCGRVYKKPSLDDKELFEKSKSLFNERREKLIGTIIPNQTIPDGYNTKQMINFNYNNWYEMFNERQLLCLSMLFEKILEISDERTRMFFLITFSDCLNANNMFTLYNMYGFKLEPLFGGHHFWPPVSPIEGNVWGTKYGRGTFRAYYRKGLRALEYQKIPYEFKYKEEQKKNGEIRKIKIKEQFPLEKLEGKFANSYEDLINNKNILLKGGTAEDLSFLPNESVDAVITDPPYYGNIMYAELSDFFYVWLRIGLKDKYPDFFGSPLTRKEREILVNKSGKDDDFYIDGMTRVFNEANRVLKNNGLMTFVFQHKTTEAWSAVLKSLLKANFYVVAVYPTHGETPTGLRKYGINYNSILICKKLLERDKAQIPWIIFETELRTKIDGEINRIIQIHPDLEVEDAFTIAMGKALEVYSQNYGNIIKNGQNFDVSEVSMDIMGEIVFDSLQRQIMERVPQVDRLSKIYAAVFASREKVTNDTINKLTRHGGLDTNIFEEIYIVKRDKKKGIMNIISPDKRVNYIKNKIEKGLPLTYIDAAHLLWDTRKEEKDFQETLEVITFSGLDKDKLEQYIKFLGNRTGNVTWKKVFYSYKNHPLQTLDDYFKKEG